MTEGWDHDPPAKRKPAPFGIPMVAGGALMLLLGSHEASDAWVDALRMWWGPVKADLGHVKRLVIYPDDGPKDSGRRTRFLRRMVEFADRSGQEIRLVYDPPYHSKDNRIERCGSSLARRWDGVLLNGAEVVLRCARRMTWRGHHPTVGCIEGVYPAGVRLTAREMRPYEARLGRSTSQPRYDIVIKPMVADCQVK